MVFKFRMEKLLKLKRMNEIQALDLLANGQRALEACNKSLETLYCERDHVHRTMSGEIGQSLQPLEFDLESRLLQTIDRRIDALLERHRELLADLQAYRQDACQKALERTGHERIRDLAYQRFRKWFRRKQRKQADEVGARAIGQIPREELIHE